MPSDCIRPPCLFGAVLEGTSPSPPALLALVAAGDSQAVRACIDRYGGLIWSLARRLALNDAEAEDAVQEVFIEIWKNAHKYDATIASETAFIAMLARRRLIDRRRRLSRQADNKALSDIVAAEAAAESWSASNSPSRSAGPDLVLAGDEAARAAEALNQLSADQQRVLRLSVYRGLSHDLISKSLSMPLGTVKTHARRGLIRLREILGAQSGDLADRELKAPQIRSTDDESDQGASRRVESSEGKDG